MGSHKKPQALRELHGTAGRNKHRDNQDQPEVVRGIGPAPDHFDSVQCKTWDYLVSVMFAGVLSESDRPSMEIMTMLFYRFRYGSNEDGADVNQLNGSELARLDSLIGRYGLTPADRTKIVIPKGKKVNAFEGM